MELLKKFKQVLLSRTSYGIMLDYDMRPLSRELTARHRVKLENRTGDKAYYHLNEEEGILTHYVKDETGRYKSAKGRRIGTKEVNNLSFRYEVVCGCDPQIKQTRVGCNGIVESSPGSWT